MRIFVRPEDIALKKDISLPQDKARYLLSVLRLREGDCVEVIDGKGKAYSAVVSAVVKRDVHIEVASEIPVDTEADAHIVLCQGILKGDKMDMVVQKAVELGTAEIIPLITERCLVRETRKTERWRKIAEESAEQCGRAVIPVVHEPMSLHRLPMQGGIEGFVFWEGGGRPLRVSDRAHSKIYLMVGPEGGFTEAEVHTAEGCGLVRTTLGKSTLRAETAAIVSMALVRHMLEN